MISATPNAVSAKDHDPAEDLREAKMALIARSPRDYYADAAAVRADPALTDAEKRRVIALVANEPKVDAT